MLIAVFSLLVSIHPASSTPAARIVGATERDVANVVWAVGRFEQAGLALPPLILRFHDDERGCDGYDGVFRGRTDPAMIEVCSVSRLVVLHELAHAWDRYNLTDADRRAFMDLRGLSEWNGGGPWKQRGVEALAEVITWGLHEDPVIGGTEGNLAAYVLLTGTTPHHRIGVEDAREAQRDVLFDPQPDWDEVS